jgi:hypothetical protein
MFCLLIWFSARGYVFLTYAHEVNCGCNFDGICKHVASTVEDLGL